MKRVFALLIAVCLFVGFCACQNSAPAEEPTTIATTATTAAPIVTEEQAKTVKDSANIHASIDYGCECVDLTFESCDDDGTYITITGDITLENDQGARYDGAYTIVLVEYNDPKFPYKVVSWNVEGLKDAS